MMKLWPRRTQFSEQRLIQAAQALADTVHLEEEAQIAALRMSGFDEAEAHRLVALLPIAFSRPVLEDLGVRTFVTEVTGFAPDGTVIKADLNRQPEYVAALRVARKHRRKGVMDQAVFSRIAESSADVDAASNALEAGQDLRGSAIASSLVGTDVARYLIR